MTMSNTFTDVMQIDSIAVTDKFNSIENDADIVVLAGLSSLEGNTWDGAIRFLSYKFNREKNCAFSEINSVSCNSGVTMVRFAGPQNELALSSHDDGCISIFSINGLLYVDSIHAHGDIASAISTNPMNCSQFISCGWDGAIFSWDWNSVDKNKPLMSISNAHYKHINDISFNPQHESIFCSGGQDGFIRMWDSRIGNNNIYTESAECVNIANNYQAVSCVEWSSSDPFVVLSGTDDGCIHAFDCRVEGRGDLFPAQKIHESGGRIRRICSSNVIFSASDDTTIAASTLHEHTENLTVLERIRKHSDYVTDLSVLYGITGHDTYTVISSSTDKTIHIEQLSFATNES